MYTLNCIVKTTSEIITPIFIDRWIFKQQLRHSPHRISWARALKCFEQALSRGLTHLKKS